MNGPGDDDHAHERPRPDDVEEHAPSEASGERISEGDDSPPDVTLVARATADELRFQAPPEVQVHFAGRGARTSRQSTTRRNIDSPVRPRRTYRRVFAETVISTRLLDERTAAE